MKREQTLDHMIQSVVDEIVLDELIRLRKKMAYIKRTSKKNLPMYKRFYSSLTDVILLQKNLKGAIR